MPKPEKDPIEPPNGETKKGFGIVLGSRAGNRNSFPIVGVGASAGGIDAIDRFLKGIPNDLGCAYVIIQHLDPTHESIMPELLQRVTEMRVAQIRERTTVEPNRVYTIPPNKDIAVLHGILHLFDRPAPHGAHMPIDHFFRSLAEDREQFAIGVILSGTGTDGTQGIRDIKGKAGLALAQEPSTAQFDGMPRSAIESGLIDIVAAPEELSSKIIEYLSRTPLIPREGDASGSCSRIDIEKITILLRSRTGNDFSQYKKSTLVRRVERRMGVHGIPSSEAYVRLLRGNIQELDLLFKELLIGVTSFFRDEKAWEALSARVIRPLLESVPADRSLRCWSAGCSTGEEAYSLAIAFKEAQMSSRQNPSREIKIFATDLDKDAINKARQGFFPPGIAADISAERLDTFFLAESRGYKVRKEIREMIVFAPQNVIMEPPFTKLDLICCRNLLIYLAHEQQQKFLPLMHYALNPGGYLFLGNAESIGSFTELFAAVDVGNRIFRKLETPLTVRGLELASKSSLTQPSAGQSRRAGSEANIQDLADQLLLRNFAPAAVLTNAKGDIIYINGSTGRFLEPAAGKANWNVMAMARKELRYRLEAAFAKALRGLETEKERSIEIPGESGSIFVDMTVHPIERPEPLKGCIMVVFAEALPPSIRGELGRDKRAEELERELIDAGDELRILRECMQASQDDLRSSNEELQSTNEELQSTIEELTSSREEMQSLNEELQTVNSELQSKVEDLQAAGDDVDDILDSTDIAALFLDEKMRVKRFTKRAAALTRLIPADIGRLVTDISSVLNYPELAEDCSRSIAEGSSIEREVPARDGSWFTIRVIPHRAFNRTVDGLVITFLDISRMKRLEAQNASAEV